MVKNSELSSFQCLQGIVLICQISCLMQILFLTKKKYSVQPSNILLVMCRVSKTRVFGYLPETQPRKFKTTRSHFCCQFWGYFKVPHCFRYAPLWKIFKKWQRKVHVAFRGVIKMFMSVYQGGMTWLGTLNYGPNYNKINLLW